MKAALRHCERAISDRPYQDENYVMSDDVNDDVNDDRKLISFDIPLRRHRQCFHAVANITQLMIENGEPL